MNGIFSGGNTGTPLTLRRTRRRRTSLVRPFTKAELQTVPRAALLQCHAGVRDAEAGPGHSAEVLRTSGEGAGRG